MKQSTFFAGAALLLSPALSWSQPDVNNAPKAENPPNRAVRARRANGQMTRAQRQQMAAQLIETRVRQNLAVAGFTETATQDAIVAFVKEQTSARQGLETKLAQISQVLRANAITDAQLAALTNDYRALSDEEEARHKKSLAALDAQIGFSTKPRLDAFLLVAGITGEQVSVLAAPARGGAIRLPGAGPARGGFGALAR